MSSVVKHVSRPAILQTITSTVQIVSNWTLQTLDWVFQAFHDISRYFKQDLINFDCEIF